MPENTEPVPVYESATEITPLDGLDEFPFELDTIGEDGENATTGGWYVVDERSDARGELFVKFQRYGEDGKIESRVERLENVEAAQARREASEAFTRAKQEEHLGVSATRLGLVGMVRGSDAYGIKNAGSEGALAVAARERSARHAKSLEELESYKNQKRRENPMKYLTRGRHRKGLNRSDFDI